MSERILGRAPTKADVIWNVSVAKIS